MYRPLGESQYEDPFEQQLAQRRALMGTTQTSDDGTDETLAGGLGAVLGGVGGALLGGPGGAAMGAKAGWGVGSSLGAKKKRPIAAQDMAALAKGLDSELLKDFTLGGM